MQILAALAMMAQVGLTQTHVEKESLMRFATMAHGFEDNLSSAQALIQQLLDAGSEPVTSAQREALTVLTYLIDEVAGLSDKVAYTVRILTSQLRLDCQKRSAYRVSELLSTAVSHASRNAKHRNIKLELKLDHLSDRLIEMDEKLVSLVLVNLVENAIKFSPPNTAVKCTLGDADGGIKCEITDRGCGISEENQEDIFDFFFRAPEHRLRSDGVGVGLGLCKQIIETWHRGTIKAASDGLGCGSTFTVRLPWSAPAGGL